jgi:hypothetical protein
MLLQSMPPIMATQHLLTLAVVKRPFLDWDIYWVDSDTLNGRMVASRQHLQLDFYCLGMAHLSLLVLRGWWPHFNSGKQLFIWE